MVFLKDPEKSTLSSKMYAQAKILEPKTDYDKYGSCLDLDKTIEMLLEEFFEARKTVQKKISENFRKISDGERGLMSFEDIKTITSFLLTRTNTTEELTYPNEINLMRSFVYSLTSKENEYVTNLRNL